jgi:hypothetical protein
LQFGIVEAFTQQMTELVRKMPAGDIVNADEMCWILNARGFSARAPGGCESMETWIEGNEKGS